MVVILAGTRRKRGVTWDVLRPGFVPVAELPARVSNSSVAVEVAVAVIGMLGTRGRSGHF